MKIHFCPLDKVCRQYGAPWRIQFKTKRSVHSIALRPQDKFATGLDGASTWTWHNHVG